MVVLSYVIVVLWLGVCVCVCFCGDLGDFECGVVVFFGVCIVVCSSVVFLWLFKSVWVKMKYVFVMGGVVSGFGKGVMVSSIGVVFKVCGFWVILIKIGMDIVE